MSQYLNEAHEWAKNPNIELDHAEGDAAYSYNNNLPVSTETLVFSDGSVLVIKNACVDYYTGQPEGNNLRRNHFNKSTIVHIYTSLHAAICQVNPKIEYTYLANLIIELCYAINHYEKEDTEELWYIGEGNEASLDDMIIGAFWHYTEWHSGQFSDGYSAYCALSSIFSPGMAKPPKTAEDEGFTTYTLLDALARKDKMKKLQP